MAVDRHWTLGAKLALVATPFVILALASVALTLWVSWQLDGGAAALNEAGRMRMQANRWALAVALRDDARLPVLGAQFERSLELLRKGDAARPLAVPWDDAVSARFATVDRNWQRFRLHWGAPSAARLAGLADETATLTADVDDFVAAIERHMARWMGLLHLLQVTMMGFAVLGALVLLVAGYFFVLEPVGRLKYATERISKGDFGARVDRVTTDEFGSLADCFNAMAERLQSLYRDLEARVVEKTSQLDEKRERLEALYDVTALAASASTVAELAGGFTQRIVRVARADGVALRWAQESSDRFVVLACDGLPEAMVDGEQCADAGYATVVSLPVRLHDRLIGKVDLFYRTRVEPTQAERSLFDALTAHLASAMENLRVTALEKETAVVEERAFIARELHDSIAQALAFLKIQVHLMRDAMDGGDLTRAQKALAEIDAGVRECYGDVRELLVHFRTRPQGGDIEPALRTTLRKFEHQAGLAAHLTLRGHGLPLPPDAQIQVLHIVQEALSNVRKHAHAEQVWLLVDREPEWRFEVRDDGVGFASMAQTDENRVGLRIMAERAERIGAALEIHSAPGEGTSIVLTLHRAPASAAASDASADAAMER